MRENAHFSLRSEKPISFWLLNIFKVLVFLDREENDAHS